MRAVPWIVLIAACRHGGHTVDDEPADPATEAAECCLGAKWWEASEDGWRSPRFKSVTLKPGEVYEAPVTLTKDLHFRFEACGDPTVTELDLYLYDADNNILVTDGLPGREPRMTWVETKRAQRKVVVYLRETTTGGPAAISWLWASQTEE